MMRIVPATQGLARRYYGEDKSLPTMRAYFLLDDAEPVGAFGFVRVGPNRMFLFSEARPGVLERIRVTSRKIGKMLTGIADEKGWTLVAEADTSIPTSGAFLARLGFEPDENGVLTRWPR